MTKCSSASSKGVLSSSRGLVEAAQANGTNFATATKWMVLASLPFCGQTRADYTLTHFGLSNPNVDVDIEATELLYVKLRPG